ncbi:MAG: LysE family transporter [Anaerolineae bacterium]|nr:LysE family transporter [Anaerolineae bacterium]
MLSYILQGLGYGFAAAVQPGPFQTYVLSQALNRGWRRALPLALAPLLSDAPIITLMLLVLSQIPNWMERFLYIASGLFILTLAWGAFKAWRAFDADAMLEASPSQLGLLKATLMNMLSPGPYIFWSLVTGPILLEGWCKAPAHGVSFLAGFYTAMVATLAALILLFGLARHLGPKINRILLGISAIALTGFGLYQLWRGTKGL